MRLTLLLGLLLLGCATAEVESPPPFDPNASLEDLCPQCPPATRREREEFFKRWLR